MKDPIKIEVSSYKDCPFMGHHHVALDFETCGLRELGIGGPYPPEYGQSRKRLPTWCPLSDEVVWVRTK